ncbi:hypothetical protein [Streptomyces albidochromogenes]|uniref:Uncharacterized protein n=1 Tax=Streptomyces albidochromogenes TaxID=329524 RepID=A0ABW6FIB1_9ACTN
MASTDGGHICAGRTPCPTRFRRLYNPLILLAALGVVKVATAEQIRQLTCPGTADAQMVRNAAKDLVAEGLVVSLGFATRINANGNRVSEKLWNLTTAGLAAASVVLDREVKEMGGTAKAPVPSGAAGGAGDAGRVGEGCRVSGERNAGEPE